MIIKDAILQLLKDNNKSQVWLAEKMEYSSQGGISSMLRRGNLNVETLYRICEFLDYEITIQPKRRAGARPAGQILIEGKGEQHKKLDNKKERTDS